MFIFLEVSKANDFVIETSYVYNLVENKDHEKFPISLTHRVNRRN